MPDNNQIKVILSLTPRGADLLPGNVAGRGDLKVALDGLDAQVIDAIASLSGWTFPTLGPGPVKDARDALVARATRLGGDPEDHDHHFAFAMADQADGGGIPESLRQAGEFFQVEGIEQTFAAPSSNPCENPNIIYQRYLAADEADALYGWSLPGGFGQGVRVCDVERAWDLAHPELPNSVPLIYGHNDTGNRAAVRHGTNALTVVAARNNLQAGIGLCPELQEISASSYATNSARHPQHQDLFGALIMATHHLVFAKDAAGKRVEEDGNILLIEAGAQHGRLPVEIDPHIYSAIELAIANRVIVIEPAGNGAVNIDRHFEQRRSGAILVGAVDPEADRLLASSCFGDQIDAYARGHSVFCLEPPTGQPFGNTSAAAALVAGAAAMLQGIYKAANAGATLTPAQMRDRLKSASRRGGQPKAFNIRTALAFPPPIEPSGSTPLPCMHFPELQKRRPMGNVGKVWSPSLTPHEDPPFSGGIHDPFARGGALPPSYDDPQNASQRFDNFVHAVHACIGQYNQTLMAVKRCNLDAANEPAYRAAVSAYHQACTGFSNLIRHCANLVEPESVFIEPVLSNGFVTDVRIIAEGMEDDGFGGPNHHSDSCYVSLPSS